MTINHYEHGRRHDTQQPITISQTVNLACGSVWLGIEGYSDIIDAACSAEEQAGSKLDLTRFRAIERWHEEAAIAEIQKRGFANEGRALVVLSLLNTLAVWTRIQHWYAANLREPPKLHPLISASVPAVAILELALDDDPFEFKLRFSAGK